MRRTSGLGTSGTVAPINLSIRVILDPASTECLPVKYVLCHGVFSMIPPPRKCHRPGMARRSLFPRVIAVCIDSLPFSQAIPNGIKEKAHKT